MSPDLAISVQAVSKAYRTWNSPASRLISPFWAQCGRLLPDASLGAQKLKERSQQSYRDFWALKDVSMDVKKGESVGIIGRNGSGKSTLLQIIAGTLRATAGEVAISGRVAALLELGSGFNPEFTGRENVYLNGAVLGFSRQEISARFDGIAAFADIGDFIDQPVKVYSSGMMVRLAFAVQTAVEPDILIVDEALSVGDFFFSQRCKRRLQELRARGTTLLFVSHDMASVRDITTRALLLETGQSRFFGETSRAVSLYFSEGSPAAPLLPTPAPAAGPVLNRGAIKTFLETAFWRRTSDDSEPEVTVLAMALLDEENRPLSKIRMGENAVISLLLQGHREVACNVAIELRNRHDQTAVSLNMLGRGKTPLTLAVGQHARVDFIVEFQLEAGLYSLCGLVGRAAAKPNRGERIDTTPWTGPIEIEWDYDAHWAPFLGMFGPPARVQVRSFATDETTCSPT